MGSKDHIATKRAEPRFPAPERYLVTRGAECVNCGKCVKVCLYEVHLRDEGDPRRMADPVSRLCRRCFTCVQRCTASTLTISNDSAFTAIVWLVPLRPKRHTAL